MSATSVGRCPRNISRQKSSRAKLALRMQRFLIRAPAISSSAISGSGTAAISMAFLADCRFQHRQTVLSALYR